MEKQNENPTNSRKTRGKAKEKITYATRFTWHQLKENALIHALKEIVKEEDKIENSFKAEYLRKLERMLSVALPGTAIQANPYIESKLKVWKKNYNSVKATRSTSGFGWNDALHMIEVDSESVWENYCKRDPNASKLRFKTFPYYDDWCTVFGNDRATGDMAKGLVDIVEDLDGERVATNGEDGEGSTSVRTNSKSPHETLKKKAKVSETIIAGLSDFVDKLGVYFERTDTKIEMLGNRMGYAHDLSTKRAAVNEALQSLPITAEARVFAAMAITRDAQTVDLFFSFSDADKMILVQKLCP